MKRIFSTNVLAGLFTIYVGCSPKMVNLSEDKLIVDIYKTPCYGSCESYEFKLDSNQVAYYKGISNTQKEGEFMSKIKSELYSEYLQALIPDSLTGLKRTYRNNMSDFQTSYYTFHALDKKVTNQGMSIDYLDYLDSLTLQIIRQSKWQKKGAE